MNGTAINRFIGGSPLAVLVRLIIVSLVVGALMVWQGIDPMDVIIGLQRILERIWRLGFGAFRDFGRYLEVGAIIVVPIWLVLRLVNWRRA